MAVRFPAVRFEFYANLLKIRIEYGQKARAAANCAFKALG